MMARGQFDDGVVGGAGAPAAGRFAGRFGGIRRALDALNGFIRRRSRDANNWAIISA